MNSDILGMTWFSYTRSRLAKCSTMFSTRDISYQSKVVGASCSILFSKDWISKEFNKVDDDKCIVTQQLVAQTTVTSPRGKMLRISTGA